MTDSTTPTRRHVKTFIPIESNPSMFTGLMHDLGVTTNLEFVDIWSIEDADQLAFVLRPVLALILVLPCKSDTSINYIKTGTRSEDADHATGQEDSVTDSGLIWFKQTIHNACGLYALLHAVCNIDPAKYIRQDTFLHTLLHQSSQDNTEAQTLRQTLLETSTDLPEIYHKYALDGATRAPEMEEEVDWHYIALVPGPDLTSSPPLALSSPHVPVPNGDSSSTPNPDPKAQSTEIYLMDGCKPGPVPSGFTLASSPNPHMNPASITKSKTGSKGESESKSEKTIDLLAQPNTLTLLHKIIGQNKSRDNNSRGEGQFSLLGLVPCFDP